MLLKWARGVLRGFEALGFGLVQVVGLLLDQGDRSCRRWMAKLGRWLCSLGILQNNFEIFGISARFLSISVGDGAGCRLKLVRLPGLVKGMRF